MTVGMGTDREWTRSLVMKKSEIEKLRVWRFSSQTLKSPKATAELGLQRRVMRCMPKSSNDRGVVSGRAVANRVMKGFLN